MYVEDVEDVKDTSNIPKGCNAMYVEDVEDVKDTSNTPKGCNYCIVCRRHRRWEKNMHTHSGS